MKYCICILLILLSATSHTFSQWNEWEDAATVREHMLWAQREGKSYFSQNKEWDVRSKDGILSSQFQSKTDEVLYVYGMDFFYCSGTYFPDRMQQECRRNTLELVRRQWKENRAIPVFSWHLENPYVPSGSAYMGCRYRWSEDCPDYPEKHRYVIHEILTGEGGEVCGNGRQKGAETESYPNPTVWFDARCREVAEIISELTDDKDRPIPFIFRLWHECEDSWMWWGRNSVSPDDYKAFFILSEKKIRQYAPNAQILWGYCPDRYWNNEEEYMVRYPGDTYVDIIGYDDYKIVNPAHYEKELEKARTITRMAKEHGKIAALFESSNTKERKQGSYFRKCLEPILADSLVRLGLVQLWPGNFDCEAQYEDRLHFLRQENVLKINIRK